MDRRRFISAFAAAGATPALAGCSNPLPDGEAPERDPQNAVEDELYTAVGELNTVALALRVATEGMESPADVEFDEAGPRDRIETARSSLDAAEEADSGSFAEEIEQTRLYADGIEAMVDTFASLLDGAAELSSLGDGFDPDAIDEMRAALSESRDPLETAVAAGDDAEAAIESADGSVLTDLDAEFEKVATAQAELVGFADGFDGLSRGYLQLVDGVDDVDAAQRGFDDERYDESETAFEDAESHFENSRRTFESADENSPERLDERFARAIDRSESLNALSGGYATMLGGMSDLETGRREFENQKYEAAESSFAAAGTAFEDASATFEVKPAPEGEFDAQFETARCRAGHLVDAANSFEDAAAAADSGSLVRARSKAEQGEQQLEDAKNC